MTRAGVPRATADEVRAARLRGDERYSVRACRQGPAFQTCETCGAEVGEGCAYFAARDAMLSGDPAPSPAGG